jgi:hypothetical protein
MDGRTHSLSYFAFFLCLPQEMCESANKLVAEMQKLAERDTLPSNASWKVVVDVQQSISNKQAEWVKDTHTVRSCLSFFSFHFNLSEKGFEIVG